jgi:hypothetical protein
MNDEITAYNAAAPAPWQPICQKLAAELSCHLPKAEAKIWHRMAVWFLAGNPIAGYAPRKAHVQLLFWSGQSFDEKGLVPEGGFKAAQALFTSADQIKTADMKKWCAKAKRIQWDYKNIVKNRGRLDKIGAW